jgi:p-hydroxybenzoate 3-monooxygenase
MMRTQVAIVGAGPAGLTLAQLLAVQGIDSVVIEARSRAYVEKRIRAGILEHNTRDVLIESGAGARLQREGLVHHGIELRFDNQAHRVAMSDYTGGRTVTVYGQTEVVKDLVNIRVAAGLPLYFDAKAVSITGADTDSPVVTFEHDGTITELHADFVIGADGFHGIGRQSIPADQISTIEKIYPFAWLGILADVPPSCDELIYANHPNGFAMHSMRSPSVSRLYLQVDPSDDVKNWSDARIWSELALRMHTPGWDLKTGPITDKSITPMRSFVASTLRYGRLFLAGDAAHIVPPTGAKGLNLAVADVTLLSDALTGFYRTGSEKGLEEYSETALRRVWRASHFSYWMTTLLHVDPNANEFDRALQRSNLAYVASSDAAKTSLSENYVGLAVIPKGKV